MPFKHQNRASSAVQQREMKRLAVKAHHSLRGIPWSNRGSDWFWNLLLSSAPWAKDLRYLCGGLISTQMRINCRDKWS